MSNLTTTVEADIIKALDIASTIAAAVAGVALPAPLAGLKIIEEIVAEAKIIHADTSAGSVALTGLEAVQKAIDNLGFRPATVQEQIDVTRDKNADFPD